MRTYVVAISLLTACGGSDLDPGSGNDPGAGNGTLVVDGTARAEPRVSNALVASDFDTEFEVRVQLQGVDVTTGSVVVTSESGAFELTLSDQRWRGSSPRYDEVYLLDVVNGEDTVEGVRVDGPDIHSFVDPLPGATVDATLPLEIQWTGDRGAVSASIDADEIDTVAISDSGTFSLAPGSLKTDSDKARENTLRLTRNNLIVPAGAAAGSEWRVSIRNEIQVLAAPAP